MDKIVISPNEITEIKDTPEEPAKFEPRLPPAIPWWARISIGLLALCLPADGIALACAVLPLRMVLPRVARLMAALRATLFGGGREETSFLFIVNGRGRQGMGLHHDGEVDSVWVQLEGRRAVRELAGERLLWRYPRPSSHRRRRDCRDQGLRRFPRPGWFRCSRGA